MAHAHVWGGWAPYDATKEYNRCLRCGQVKYRRYTIQPQ